VNVTSHERRPRIAVDGWLTPPRRRALFHGLVLAGLLFLANLFLVAGPNRGVLGFDTYAYWSLDLAHPYRHALGDYGFYAYSPAFALIVAPLTLLPWPAMLLTWWSLMVASLLWIGRRWVLVLLAFPPVAYELFHGNIHLMLAAAILLGFRYPAAWAFVLLTKVTPGIALLWFVARREWRHLIVALTATTMIVAGTFVLLPSQWADWIALLLNNAGGTPPFPAIPIPLWIRLPIAVALVWWGAKRDAYWTVPAAATLAMPVLWVASLSVLIACWPLASRERRQPFIDPASEPVRQAAPAGA
jgi:hypothetical protein